MVKDFLMSLMFGISPKPKAPFGTGYLDEMGLWADPDYQRSILNFIESGGSLKIVVRNNTSPFIRELAKKYDNVELFYELKSPEYLTQFSGNHIYQDLAAFYDGFGIIFPYRHVLDRNKKWFSDTEKYPVPAEKVDTLFGMIENNSTPDKIIWYLAV